MVERGVGGGSEAVLSMVRDGLIGQVTAPTRADSVGPTATPTEGADA
jgi:hypothetical protein